MRTTKCVQVRILGLDDDVGRVLPEVARAVRDFWTHGSAVECEIARTDDDAGRASRTIRGWCDRDRVEVVFTVGRSGPASEDFAPEMTAALLDRALPGIEERMYLAPARSPQDLLFRGRAGMRRGTLVVNLPSRPARARVIVRFLGPIVGHALEKARGSDRECAAGGAAR